MAKSSQTFKKRQREHKLRERAQQKREQRAARRNARKAFDHSSESAVRENREFGEVNPAADTDLDAFEGKESISAL